MSQVRRVAAALYIASFREQAEELLSKFKWGLQFITLNKELLAPVKDILTAISGF